jgi:CHASE2 domain-containing sensor protein
MSAAPDSLARRWASVVITRRGRPLAAAALLLLAAVLGVSGAPVIERVRHAGFDAYQRLLPRERVKAPAVIVEIDEKSLVRYGQWPWPRTLLAHLVERIHAGGAFAIGLDFIFPEVDRLSPGVIAESLPGHGAEDLIARLKAQPSNDSIFARALAGAPTVLGVAGFDRARLPPGAALHAGFAPARQRGGDAAPYLRAYEVALANLPELARAASGHALLSAEFESGRARRVPLVSRVGDTLAPSMSLELMRVATRRPAFDVRVGSRGVEAIGVEDITAPTQPDGRIWVHYSRHDPSRFVSAADVLAGTAPADAFRERLVLVGVTGLALTDYVTTPLDDRIPGVEVHANVLENIFDGRVLRRPYWAAGAEALALTAAGALLVAVMPSSRVFLWPALLAGLLGALVAGGFAAYRYGQLLFDAVLPVLGTLAVFIVMMGVLFAEALMQRRRLRQRLLQERETKARLAGELDAARRIQMATLPRAAVAFPGEKRFSLYAHLEPAREVGGDLYDFFMLDRDRLFFLVGDVSGKGLPASMLMVVSKALVKSLSARNPASVSATLTAAARDIGHENPEQFFVTLVAGVLDARNGELRLANAGHDAPYLVRRAGVERLDASGGPPLCTVEGFSYGESAFKLAPGDVLCMMTDGITEAMNGQGELYGTARLAALIGALAREPGELAPERVGTAIREEVARFRGAAEPADDLAILAVRWTG